jgi:hypothetical protein
MSLQGFRSIEKYITAIPTYLKILLIRGGFDSLVAISKMDKVVIDDLDKLCENNCESLRLMEDTDFSLYLYYKKSVDFKFSV